MIILNALLVVSVFFIPCLASDQSSSHKPKNQEFKKIIKDLTDKVEKGTAFKPEGQSWTSITSPTNKDTTLSQAEYCSAVDKAYKARDIQMLSALSSKSPKDVQLQTIMLLVNIIDEQETSKDTTTLLSCTELAKHVAAKDEEKGK